MASPVFIDSSALLAVLDGADSNHGKARPLWKHLVESGKRLVSHNYVLLETSAVTSRRLGLGAARLFEADIAPLLKIVWVDQELHHAAVGASWAAGRRSLSLVDCVSFEVMRRAGIRAAFAFDRHYREFGFETL